MTGTSLIAVREDPYRVYVVYNPTRSVDDIFSYPKQFAVILNEARIYNGTLTFARRALTTSAAEEVLKDPNLKREVEVTWQRLHAHYFDAVWFYGAGLCEFTRNVALVAMRRRVTVMDYSDRHSLLNRYLEQWILGKSVSLH